MELIDFLIRTWAGPEPAFDPVMRDFLDNIASEMRDRLRPGSLVEAVSLGEKAPWLWRLTFSTQGLALEESGQVVPCQRHMVAVRFLPDYLRRVDRFEMTMLLEPARPFHPNLRDRHICLEIYPGEPLVELCDALHRLFSWKLRQLSETDALNPDACAWGRAHLDQLPLDQRSLFGRTLSFNLEAVEAPRP